MHGTNSTEHLGVSKIGFGGKSILPAARLGCRAKPLAPSRFAGTLNEIYELVPVSCLSLGHPLNRLLRRGTTGE